MRYLVQVARASRIRWLSTGVSRECYIERLQGPDSGIAILNMNRPKAKNAVGKTFLKQFSESLNELGSAEQPARVVIIRSLVDKVFCAGADLKERATMSPEEVSVFVSGIRSGFTQLENLGVPTISVINGAALGGGLELALATDLRVAGPLAKLGLPETKLAIIPGAGGTQRLPRLIGLSKAKELVFTGSVVNGCQAAVLGLVNHSVETDPMDKALDLARSILPNGPVALRMAKLAMSNGLNKDLTGGLEYEKECYAQIIPTQDRLEGLAAFREKRTPVYKGL